ncbi:MAG: type II toxin-antitoxin system VapB family antitoxin [Gammaproteobacteria bacterium]
MTEKSTATGTVLTTNRTQAVRLPAESRFPDTVKRVIVRVVGQERVLAPVESSWDSFSDWGEPVSDDFMTERASQEQPERESL